MNKMIRKVYNTDTTLLMWLERSKDGSEARWEEVSASSRDGEVTATVKHLINGTIIVEKMATMPLSTAIGAEVQDKFTAIELAEINKNSEVMNKLVEVEQELDENKQERTKERTKKIKKEDKKTFNSNEENNEHICLFPYNVDSVKVYKRPEWLKDEENEYWNIAQQQTIIREFGDTKWTREQVERFINDYIEIIKKDEKEKDNDKLQDALFVLMLRIGKNYTSKTQDQNRTPLEIIRNMISNYLKNKKGNDIWKQVVSELSDKDEQYLPKNKNNVKRPYRAIDHKNNNIPLRNKYGVII